MFKRLKDIVVRQAESIRISGVREVEKNLLEVIRNILIFFI